MQVINHRHRDSMGRAAWHIKRQIMSFTICYAYFSKHHVKVFLFIL